MPLNQSSSPGISAGGGGEGRGAELLLVGVEVLWVLFTAHLYFCCLEVCRHLNFKNIAQVYGPTRQNKRLLYIAAYLLPNAFCLQCMQIGKLNDHDSNMIFQGMYFNQGDYYYYYYFCKLTII